jgi:nucleoside-diphosphate-sugar epimerase
MKAVVVGGSGFIGNAIVRCLIDGGDEVVVVDRSARETSAANRRADVRDVSALTAAFQGAHEVYHVAGVLGTSELNGRPQEAIEVNVTGAVNVFEAAARAGVARVFLASKPNVWRNTYTITKYASEQFAELFAEHHELDIRTLRYFNAYGPRQCLRPIRKIIPTFAAQALRGQPLEVFGDGEQTVDMVYVDDLARITVDFMRAPNAAGAAALDCGTGQAMTVNAVARAVNAYLGNDAGIRHVPMRRGEEPNTQIVADIAPLESTIGPLTFTEWDDALAMTLRWYAALDPREIDEAVAFHFAA